MGGLRTGVELGFTPFTPDEAIARRYAGPGGIMFELQQTLVARGADLTFASQFPAQPEVTWGPGLLLEVHSMRPSSGLLVVETRPTINIEAITMEQWFARKEERRLLERARAERL